MLLFRKKKGARDAMEWMERWNRAMDEIERNLTGQIDCEHLGRIACCSAYHFQRMFTYLANVSLGEYVRRRRMSLAAVDLQSGRDKVIDVAARYGYESPTAFNRAFRAVHGVAPSQVRSGSVAVKCYPRLVFHLTVQGGVGRRRARRHRGRSGRADGRATQRAAGHQRVHRRRSMAIPHRRGLAGRSRPV